MGQGVEEAIHVSDLERGLRLPDTRVWEHVKNTESVIMTKDLEYLPL